MSHTDKTRPDWVQVADPHNRGWLRELHDHTGGFCDLAPTLPRGKFGDNRAYLGYEQQIHIVKFHHQWRCWRLEETGYCFYWYTPKAANCNSLWPRTPRSGRSKHRSEPSRDGRARMELRRLRKNWKHADREDIDSLEHAPTSRILTHKWWKD